MVRAKVAKGMIHFQSSTFGSYRVKSYKHRIQINIYKLLKAFKLCKYVLELAISPSKSLFLLLNRIDVTCISLFLSNCRQDICQVALLSILLKNWMVYQSQLPISKNSKNSWLKEKSAVCISYTISRHRTSKRRCHNGKTMLQQRRFNDLFWQGYSRKGSSDKVGT